MKSVLRSLILATTLVSSMGFAAGNKNADPVNDVHKEPMDWCPVLQTDMISTDFNRVGDEYVVEMTMTEDIRKDAGYKEYYFWMDITHDTRNGYQPYFPESVAWPDLYANYRIFYSVNANGGSGASERVAVQNCLQSNCAQDDQLYGRRELKVSVEGPVVTFRWPVGMLPELDKAKQIRMGYTTYSELQACHGEDDSPQWGRKAFRINLKGQ